MIYLLKVYGPEFPLLKIGYASDVDKRFKAYLIHYPFSEILKVREGEEDLEKYLHLYFSEFKYPYLNEWFYYDPYIIDNFESVDKMVDPKLLITRYKRSRSFREKLISYSQIKSSLNWFEEDEFEKYYVYFKCNTNDNFLDSLEGSDLELFTFLEKFYNMNAFIDRMKYLCHQNTHQNTPLKEEILKVIPEKYKDYYNIIGEEKIISLGYQKSKLKRELESLTTLSRNKDSETGIFSDFKVGDRLTLKEIKEKLRDIYEKEGIYKTPKATDLNSLFTLKRVNFKISGKRVEGFELLPLESPPENS